MSTLDKILVRSAREFGDRPACAMRVGFRNKEFSYSDVYGLSKRLAVFMRGLGAKKNSKVMLMAPCSLNWTIVFWACSLLGAVVVPLNTQSRPELIKKIAQETGAKVFFKFVFYKDTVPRGMKVFDVEFLEDLVSGVSAKGFKRARNKADDLAEILYTSGTTGEPKGVMLTHRNLVSNSEKLGEAVHVSKEDRLLSILPLSHIFEQTAGCLIPFRAGALVVYAHKPTAIADLLKEFEITKMVAVPEFLDLLMGKIEKKLGKWIEAGKYLPGRAARRMAFWLVHRKIGGKLTMVASGGAPLDPELEKKWKWLGITLLQGYGLTETSPVLTTNTVKDHRLGSVGKVLSGVSVKISKEGEVLAKGPNVFSGYFKNPIQTRKVFSKDGWFRTGDGGEFDADGFLFLKGRKKYMILGPGGQNVYPEDLEMVLDRVPGVKCSCVIGLPKGNGKVEIHAVLIGRGSTKLNGEGVIDIANEVLDSFQQISSFSLWHEDDFPRSATRKIKKQVVIDYLKSQSGRKGQKKSKDGYKGSLIELLAAVTRTDALEINSSTKIVPELGLDSLLRVELVARIEEKFVVEIEESKITKTLTVKGLQNLINKKAPVSHDKFRTWKLWKITAVVRRALQAPLFWYVGRYAKLDIKGLENLEGINGPVIFMPTHLSYLDGIVVPMALPTRFRRRISFAAAKDVLYLKYKRWAWLAEFVLNTFPLPRTERSNISRGLERFGKMLDRGYSVVVFPEGKMSTTGKLLPLKPGSGMLATTMEVAIVPMRLIGTNQVLEPGKIWDLKKHKVTVKFGKVLKFRKTDSEIEALKMIEKELKRLE